MSIKNWGSILCALAVALCLSTFAVGQETTGTIVGTVKDASGGVVPGATVTATIPTQGNRQIRQVVTNDEGAFTLPNLPVSLYTVTVEAANFKKSVQTEVKVDIGQRRGVDVILEAGNISEVVTVEAGALSVEVSIPQSSTTITGEQATELSVNNRNWVQLITLAPGVTDNLADLVPVGSFSPDGSPNIMAISVNGARQSQNTYTVDGADITDRGSNITIQASPSLDSIGEFKVLRSLYPAESGRSGGGQVNVVTRSGTDQFRGSLFEFVRNDVFNANSFLINRNKNFGVDENGKAKKAPFRYNNYGFTIGGPIWFLNIGEREPDEPWFAKVPKTYFFFSEERRNERRYLGIGPSNVPTAGMRNGVFTNPICLVATQTSGNARSCLQILPAGTPISSLATIDPASAAYVQHIYSKMPLPDSGSGTFLSAYPDRYTYDFQQEVLKIDTSITKDWSAYYRYQRDKVPFYAPNGVFSPTCAVPFLCPSDTDAPGRTHTFQTTFAPKPNLIIEGRYVRAYGGIFIKTAGLLSAENSPIPLTTPYARNDARVPLHTGFTTLSNLQGYGDGNNWSEKNDFSGNVTWLASGKHTFKFGASTSMYRKVEDQLGGSVAGTFSSFANTITPPASGFIRGTVCVNAASAAIACPSGLQTTEQQWANFLMGNNVIFTQNKYNTTADFRQKNYEAYAQDEIKLRSNLTMYLGVRYSYFGPPWDKNGLLNNFVPELYKATEAPTISFNGTTSTRGGGSSVNMCSGIITNTQQASTLPQCKTTPSPFGKYVYETPKTNFGPRFGLAWDITGQGTTVVRTGYGIYHDQVLLGNVELQLGNSGVFQESVTFTGGTMSNPMPAGQTTAQALATGVPTLIRAVPTDYKNPYMQHWSLDVQHLLAKKTFVSVGYYGSKGTHLIGVVDINNLQAGEALTKTCVVSGASVPCQGKDVNNVPIAFGNGAGMVANEQILDQIRPYRGYRSIAMVKPIFNSNYHSLQAQLTQRFTGASQVNLAYTWGKNLTDNQTDRSSAPMNVYDSRAEYGRAQLDRRHVVRLNYIYELPFFSAQKGFVGKMLGGWQLSGITSYQSGLPYSLSIGGSIYDPAGLGYFGSSPAGARPNITCDPNANAPHTFEQWFDTSCVQTTYPGSAAAVPGNSPRGIIEARRYLSLT